MKKYPFLSTASLLVCLLCSVVACKKENSIGNDDVSAIAIQAAAISQQAIAVASGADGDSIYIVQTCVRGEHRDSVAFSALPATIGSYLASNYAAYASQKAFTIQNSTGTLTGYVVIILFNGNPVGLKFDASGTFVKVLEQREGHDLAGTGWHHGGRFDNRDGKQRDTVNLSALPTVIKSYFATNAAQDTLLTAFRNRDKKFVVISKNNGLYASAFDSAGTFINRVQLPAHSGRINAVSESALPAIVQSYLSTTYPGYVFSKAFSTGAATIQGYVVVIEANSTRYAIEFDSNGAFLRSKPIR